MTALDQDLRYRHMQTPLGAHLCGRFRMLHLDQSGVGNQDPALDFAENVRMAQADEVIEWTSIGNNDHACDYRLFGLSTRSSVAMSLSRSSTV